MDLASLNMMLYLLVSLKKKIFFIFGLEIGLRSENHVGLQCGKLVCHRWAYIVELGFISKRKSCFTTLHRVFFKFLFSISENLSQI